MRYLARNLWHRISRIGLRENESVLQFREVIFLNRLLALIPLIMGLYIPLEIYFNGYSMLHVVFLMIFLFLLPLPLHHLRLFRLAHYQLFITANIIIVVAGLLVGKGINNHVALIPVVLVGIILFKTNPERIIVFLITVIFYLLQQYLFDVIPPSVTVAKGSQEIFSGIFFLMAILLSFLAGFYFIRINTEYEKIITDQNASLLDKNNEITASITYAKRIQNAILPHPDTVKRLLPDSFILYKPKDIVAGDFYWLEQKDNIVLFAAADATGHGVPGAMVSVVCHNALARSVREFNLKEPASILDKTREIVIAEFTKNEEDVNDGMDISLCALNTKNNELNWAGANNLLLLIRQGEITELRPDKQPVGRFSAARAFTNHTLQLQAGDQIYLFTDGYSDQFGGEAGKKLKYRKFRELLLHLHSYPAEKQHQELGQALENWQGKLEQVDDICVIGVKIQPINATS